MKISFIDGIVSTNWRISTVSLMSDTTERISSFFSMSILSDEKPIDELSLSSTLQLLSKRSIRAFSSPL